MQRVPKEDFVKISLYLAVGCDTCLHFEAAQCRECKRLMVLKSKRRLWLVFSFYL